MLVSSRGRGRTNQQQRTPPNDLRMVLTRWPTTVLGKAVNEESGQHERQTEARRTYWTSTVLHFRDHYLRIFGLLHLERFAFDRTGFFIFNQGLSCPDHSMPTSWMGQTPGQSSIDGMSMCSFEDAWEECPCGTMKSVASFWLTVVSTIGTDFGSLGIFRRPPSFA